MSRSASFKPSRTNRAKGKWCVSIPPHFSDTGGRQRLFFETKTEAAAVCEKLRARVDNFGISLSAMTPARIAAASEAFKMLDPLGIDLLTAVKGYVDAHKAR